MKTLSLFLMACALSTSLVHAKITLAMGTLHGCYISSQNKLFCFGTGGEGQLGNGKNDKSDKPVEVTAVGEVVSVDMHGSVIGDNNTCAATKAGKVYCWGSNTYGILGQDDYDMPSSNKPILIADVDGAKSVVVGYGHACALLNGNKVKCWGANGYGQLGTAEGSKSMKALEIAGLPANISKIYAGHSHNCVIADSKFYCWGANNLGQMGQGTMSDENTIKPVLVNIPKKVLNADLFADVSCVGTENGAYCWGATENLPDVLGQGTEYKKMVPEDEQYKARIFKPVQVRDLAGKVDDIVVRRADACALVAGKVHCWGANTSPNSNSSDEGVTKCLPQTVSVIPGLTGVSLSSDNYDLCAVQANDKINCWSYVMMCNAKTLKKTVTVKNFL